MFKVLVGCCIGLDPRNFGHGIVLGLGYHGLLDLRFTALEPEVAKVPSKANDRHERYDNEDQRFLKSGKGV
jgi:hypothetical protein